MDQNNENVTAKARSALFWVATSSVGWQAIAWVFTLLMARILDPIDYGLYAIIGLIFPYVEISASLRLNEWLLQEEDLDEEKTSSALIFTVGLGLISSVAIFLFAPFWANFYEAPELTKYIRLAAVYPLMKGLNLMFTGLFQRSLDMKAVSKLVFWTRLFRGSFQLALAYWGFGFRSLLFGILAMEALQLVWFLTRSERPKVGSFNFDSLKTGIRFGAYAAGANLLWTCTSTLDDAMVGKFLGPTFLGFYTMACGLSEMPLSKLNVIISYILTSYFAKFKNQPSELFSIYMRFAKLFASLMAPCLLGLLLVAPEGIPLLLSEKWAPATTMFQVMCFVWFVRSVCDHFANLFKAIGRPELVLRYQIFNSIVFLGVFYFCLTRYGEAGIYYAWLGVAPLAFIYHLTLFSSVTGISPINYIQNIKAPLTAVGLMCISCLLARSVFESSSLILVITILVGGLSYPLFYYLLFPTEAKNFIKTLTSRQLD